MKKTLQEILKALREPVDERDISQKDTGKFKADFIQHATLRDLLDERAPGWSSSCRVSQAAGRIYVTVELTIEGSDGTISRENIGNESDSLGPKDYGDPSSNAHAMALGRAAMEFGLGRDLWLKKQKPHDRRIPPAPSRQAHTQRRHQHKDVDDYR